MDQDLPCPFCAIANAYPPEISPVPAKPDPERITPNCYLLLSTESIMAFLDILPIEQGHVLVIPRKHRGKLKDVSVSEGGALGSWLPIVSKAIMRALGRPEGDWNVVQNNGASAAQVVPHVHYHIIPRGSRPEVSAKSWAMFGRGQRNDLDDDEAGQLAPLIRDELNVELQAIADRDPQERKLLGKL